MVAAAQALFDWARRTCSNMPLTARLARASFCASRARSTTFVLAARPERIERVDDRSLLVADHPHFLEIDADRRQIFGDIADVLVLGAARQDLSPITRSAAVTTSFAAGELAVGMITCGGRADDAQRSNTRAYSSHPPLPAIVSYAASSHPRALFPARSVGVDDGQSCPTRRVAAVTRER
jgi:hypothetical protein